MEKRRLHALDVARGIAMISIVLGNLGKSSISHVVFTYHLPIFYLIGGYFLDERSTMSAFLRKTARQLLLPYYFTCLIYLILGVISNLRKGIAWNDELSIRLQAVFYAAGDNWSSPFPIHRIGAIWFLWAMFWGTAMLKLLLKCKPAIRVATVCLVFAACQWSWHKLWLPLSIQAGGCGLLYLYLGYLLRKALTAVDLTGLSAEVKAAGMLLMLGMWLWTVYTFKGFWLVHCEIKNGMTDIIGSLCGCCLLVALSGFIDRKLRLLARWFAFYGRYSLLFLSIHLLEMSWMRYKKYFKVLIGRLGWQATDALYLAFVILLKLVLITGLMLALFRLPFIRRIYSYPARTGGEREEPRGAHA